jgi:succinate dehydrogenase / fumarate reductase cytochrome b subunit
MFASIAHRGTGVLLYLSVIAIVIWLALLAAGPDAYAAVVTLAPGWLIGLKLSVLSGVLVYHLLNGVRHLAWDAGKGFAPKTATLSAWLVLIVAFAAFAAPAALVAMHMTGGA